MTSRSVFPRRLYVCTSCRIQLFKARSQYYRNFASSQTLSAEASSGSQDSTASGSSGDQRKYNIPQVFPTSSQELDSLIQKCRKYYFIPWGLSPAHRHIIFNRKSGHQRLINSPDITIDTIHGERIKLEPLPPQSPFQKASILTDVIKLMGETNEFDNVQGLMEGFKIARTPFREIDLENVTRKANTAGKIDIVLRCVGMVDRTGASLRHRAFARELFLGFHMLGQRSEWSGEGLAEALKQAENMATKMEYEKAHVEKPQSESDPIPLRMTPEIAGVGLELSAAQAVNDFGRVDRDGKVKNYAKRVLALWNNGTWEVDTVGSKIGVEPGDPKEEAEKGQSRMRKDQAIRRSYALQRWLPLYNGLRLLKSVSQGVEPSLKTQLAQRLEELDPIVRHELAETKALQRKLDSGPKREVSLYSQIGVE